MTEEEWHRFVWAGDPRIITVGELARDLCKVIGASSPIIRMEHNYALKCQHRHGFGAYELMMLPTVRRLGGNGAEIAFDGDSLIVEISASELRNSNLVSLL